MTDPLTDIGLRMGTDKASWHGYTKYYHEILEPFRDQKLFFMELGFGGYEWGDTGGESVRMWAEYAPAWDIAVVDLHDKDLRLVPETASFYRGSQDDADLMEHIVSKHGRPTIVVDDASHVSALTNKSFEILWPTLMPGGWYIIEDIGTSYLSMYHGDSGQFARSLTDNVLANSRFGKEHGILSPIEDYGIDVVHVMPNSVGARKQL